jgi:signal transduction histidine kinase/HAMP domain-containing protein
MTAEAAPQSRRRRILERLLGPRIAQKIFLGYVLPLSFLLAFGIVLPIFLWFYLGRSIAQYEDLVWLTDHAISLKRNAADTESHARAFIRYRDRAFEAQYIDARDAYRARYREIHTFVDMREDSELSTSMDRVGSAFGNWLQIAVSVPYDSAMRQSADDGALAVKVSQSKAIHEQFGPVIARIDQFILVVDQKRREQIIRSRAADLMRQITTFVIPIVALILSLLVGRSTALGITRPLEELTHATRELERGEGSPRMLLDDTGDEAADDEIGDLQRSFREMARTIGQREAVLHAQNEAVGALNRRIESVLNATNDGILMLDRAGGFSVVNQRLADLFGIETENLLDHTFAQAGPLLFSRFKNKAGIRQRLQELIDDPEGVADETHDLSEPPGSTVRLYSAPVRGHPHWYGDAALGVAHPPDLLGRIFVFRDVTRETLLDRIKTEFVSTVSHELRTPLTAIKGYVDLMVSGQTGPLTDVQSEFLTLVQGSTRRLTDLINDMLDISRIESGRMELRQESVDYLPLVRQTIRMMQQEAEAKGITLGCEVAGESEERTWPAVRGDADRITQVLTNFLSNGIKYTPAGGQVVIQIEFEDDFVTTCVADTGIGIGVEDQRRLFQKFFRADNSTTREAGGTGLGLAITKAILERLNGSVWVESVRGLGSRFFFTLPCVTPAELAAANTAVELPGNVGRRLDGTDPLVLPVTADLATLHRLGHELRRQGFVTSGASTVAEAVRRVRDLRPDVVLIDPLSPRLDARAVLRQLRGLGTENLPPIVLGSLQLHSNNLAVFRDDVALLSVEAVSCDEFAGQIAQALQAGEERREAHEGDAERRAGVIVFGSAALGDQVEASLANAGLGVKVTRASTREAMLAHLQTDASVYVPDVVIVGADVDPGLDLASWIAKLRRRRSDEWIACILLVENEVLENFDIRTLAPIGTGTVRVDFAGEVLRRAMRSAGTHQSVDNELPVPSGALEAAH